MKNSRVLIFILLLIFALSLVACSKSTPIPTSSSSAGGTSPTASSSGSTSLDGKSILEAKCQSCHGLAVVYGQQQGADGWTQIVDSMIARGAVLTADERTALIAYLAATYK